MTILVFPNMKAATFALHVKDCETCLLAGGIVLNEAQPLAPLLCAIGREMFWAAQAATEQREVVESAIAVGGGDV